MIDSRCVQELILKLTQKFPEITLTIFGEVVVPITLLQDQKNIEWRGKVTYQVLPALIADQDLFILPYHVNEFTQTINPLKLKEYMSTNKPVLATSLHEIKKFQDYLWVAHSHEEFLNYVDDWFHHRSCYDYTKTKNYLLRFETWQSKAQQLRVFLKGK